MIRGAISASSLGRKVDVTTATTSAMVTKSSIADLMDTSSSGICHPIQSLSLEILTALITRKDSSGGMSCIAQQSDVSHSELGIDPTSFPISAAQKNLLFSHLNCFTAVFHQQEAPTRSMPRAESSSVSYLQKNY